MFVLIELARLLHAWLAVENGARFGVRYAVTGEFDSALCVDLDASGTLATDLEKDNARVPSIINAARAGAVAILRSARQLPPPHPATSTSSLLQPAPATPTGRRTAMLPYLHGGHLRARAMIPAARATGSRSPSTSTTRSSCPCSARGSRCCT